MEITMETLKGLKRSNYCGTLRIEHADREVVLMGWIQKSRNLGGLIFADIRDTSGLCQIVFDINDNKELFEKAENLGSEYVVAVKGIIKERQAKELLTLVAEKLTLTVSVDDTIDRSVIVDLETADSKDITKKKAEKVKATTTTPKKTTKVVKEKADVIDEFEKDFLDHIEVVGNIHDKARQKQALIDMMRGDEELGLYD